MSALSTYFFIAIGGALGACARFGISELALKLLPKGFPFGTLAVNILGSLLMGILYGLLDREMLSHPHRVTLGVGFLGALTTFSTFSMDTLLLLQQGQWLKVALNVLLNVGMCIFMAWIGLMLTTQKG
ncbi:MULTISPECIES: fluoride efflux transporter CrcB [Pseudoalteromonas]|uniref:Fluoride-specific ion channel FluC n=1 Tax=Pseudoalteromonas ruthenica TaxID=151081 RepID=A0A0F4PUJ8_9GAMM|nr:MULTISPECIES: fluoride efflux transporter CrcB [Pseudoalteromonas]KJY99092.1 camphor resistance protein CrcB [Pseudoalteromonas ruthenica]KJY99865.1 camphor resistance protein CrcB [Pseudoalteromonas ruthenica]MCF2861659.1 fluoride efflux transporter CrcB [Pseudoalteromonas sp. CNAT2-18]MCG7542572.1 fluoride efflux transporter CrcB [Pseudoalteromonas sp. MM17-2]MCG7557303.1 fluoride efflux transporter CrcB [Pseudoalteromonas sp. CNAT2-18.1]|tara:strand:+ start:887 stop:1270 length:384 start_codon:yes stop_codon:yes gene_type:complete